MSAPTRAIGDALDDALDGMPSSLRPLAAIAGARRVEAFLRQQGGRALYVPRSWKPGHKLERLLGARGLAWLVERHGGEEWHVPTARPWLTRIGARRLRTDKGWSVQRIARHLGISERQCLRAIAGVPRPDRPVAVNAASPRRSAGDCAGAADPWGACPVCGHHHRRRRRAALTCTAVQLPLPLDVAEPFK